MVKLVHISLGLFDPTASSSKHWFQMKTITYCDSLMILSSVTQEDTEI